MSTQPPSSHRPKHPDGPGDGDPKPIVAAMVGRDPLLRLSIASREQDSLIGEQPVAQHLPPAVQLEWNRSHGET
jgi:hypothetical protein